MPVELERKLKRRARKKGLKGKRAAAYVYGTLRNTGWKPKREKKVGEQTSVQLKKVIKRKTK